MKIVVLEPLGVAQEQLHEILSDKIQDRAELIYYDHRSEDVEELIQRSIDADIVVLSNLPYPRSVLQRLQKLKLIVVAFTGVDHVDMACCKERDIMVCNCAGYSTCAVADLVFGMLISFYRNIAQCDHRAREHGVKDGLVGFELEGKKFGVVGMGQIGKRVAMIAHSFGCEVYAYTRTPHPVDHVQFVSLDELLASCDIVSLHIPFTKESKHMIGEWELKRMKKDAILINTARGGVIDNIALAQALQEHEIGGALIDVLDSEPPFAMETPLLHAPNTIITPHIAFASKQAMVKRAHIVAENIDAYLNDEPQNVIQ